MSKTSLIAEPGVPQILIAREVNAPREIVYRAYTEPDLLVQWLRTTPLRDDDRPPRDPRRRDMALPPPR
jgi:uncharacterized protein YndB with AHSA1/START domain